MKQSLDEINRFYRQRISTPLQFGNPEQIQTIKQWAKAIEEFEEEQSARANPDAPLKRFRVEFSWREFDSEIVEAKTAEEAEEMIEEEYGYQEDFQIEITEFVK